MPLKIYWFSNINPSLKEKVGVTNFFFVTRAAVSFFGWSKTTQSANMYKASAEKQNWFAILSHILYLFLLFIVQKQGNSVKRVGIKSTVSLSEL